MKQKKQSSESLPEIPAKPLHDVPRTDRERAENEGMTLKPNRDPMNHEGMKIDKTKAEGLGAAPQGHKSDAHKSDAHKSEAHKSDTHKSDTHQPGGLKAATPVQGGAKVEGEGSYTAARRYREGLEQSVKKGDADELAKEAADALDGPEGESLRAAEERGKQAKIPHTQDAAGAHAKAPQDPHAKASPQQAPAKADKQIKKPSPSQGHDRQPVSHR